MTEVLLMSTGTHNICFCEYPRHIFLWSIKKSLFFVVFIPRHTIVAGYYGFTLVVRESVCPSDRTSGLIWVQTVCKAWKVSSRRQKSPLVGKALSMWICINSLGQVIWLAERSRLGILIYSAWQRLTEAVLTSTHNMFIWKNKKQNFLRLLYLKSPLKYTLKLW